MSKLKKNLFVYFLFVSMLLIAIRSQEILESARKSLLTCFTAVIPSLFPFMVLSSLFVNSYTENSFPVTSRITGRIFGIRSASNAAFICGIVCGYPIGAKCTCELYKAKKISASEAESLIAYSNNSGPLFVIGAVGVGILGSVKAGIILYMIQLVSVLCAAWILKSHTVYSITVPCESFKEKAGFTQSICQSAANVINVCGFIVFFSVINELIRPCIKVLPYTVQSLIFSILEITNAVIDISTLKYPYSIKLSFISFALGWSGLSVHMQVKSILKDTGLSMKKYYITRFFMGLSSALITYMTLEQFDTISLFVCKNKPIVFSAILVICLICATKKRGSNSPSLSI